MSMAEEMNALKAHHKQQRKEKATVNIAMLQELNIPAREQSENVFRVDTSFGAVMYYPPSNKWQHRGRVFRGNVQDFRDWLKKHHYL